MKYFEGMYAAIPTPMNENGSIREDSFKTICERIIDAKMQGILVCGSTGEYPLLTIEERHTAIKCVCDFVEKRAKVIVGCGCRFQKETIEMVKYAEATGADMALVVPPYYMQTTEEGIYEYYRSIAENCTTIRLLIYNYPSATNVRLSVPLIKKLSELPNVVGIKNSDEMEHTSQLIGAVKDNARFGVINGYEHLIMGTLCSGGDGAMGIIQALAPKQMMDLYNAVRQNDLATAMRINERMRNLYTLMELEPCPAPVKAAFELMGIRCGKPRRPMLPASEQMIKSLYTEMKKVGLL